MGIVADISLILLFGLVLCAIAHRLGQPLILGAILAGVLLGPHTGGITISDPHEIELLAEIGIALLLFSIGIELSFDALLSVRRVALFGTLIQMSLTMLLGWALGRWMGFDNTASVWLGALISVSSTMVVVKTLVGSGLMGTMSGRVMVGMLLAQDLAVIPLMIFLPQFSGPSLDPTGIALAAGRAAAVLLVLVLGGRRVVPWLMHRIVSWGSRELFILGVITISLGIGYLSHLLGLSYALGAFLAGLVMSKSEYGHQALSDIIPLRDLFGLLFFASVGMLFDPSFLLQHLPQVLLLVVVVLVGKGLLFGTVTRAFGYRNIVPIAAALTMSQIGEFSFLLAQIGRQTEAVSAELHAIVVSTTVITMLTTPYLARLAAPVYRWPRWQRVAAPDLEFADTVAPASPVVIAGAGRVGWRIARILSREGIPIVLIDFDHRQVDRMRRESWPVVYGDASQDPVLMAAGIETARMALITVPTAVQSIAVAKRMRVLAPELPLVVRTDTLEGIDSLRALGALHTVQPEFEAALEMSGEALLAMGAELGRVGELLREERREPLATPRTPGSPPAG